MSLLPNAWGIHWAKIIHCAPPFRSANRQLLVLSEPLSHPTLGPSELTVHWANHLVLLLQLLQTCGSQPFSHLWWRRQVEFHRASFCAPSTFHSCPWIKEILCRSRATFHNVCKYIGGDDAFPNTFPFYTLIYKLMGSERCDPSDIFVNLISITFWMRIVNSSTIMQFTFLQHLRKCWLGCWQPGSWRPSWEK